MPVEGAESGFKQACKPHYTISYGNTFALIDMHPAIKSLASFLARKNGVYQLKASGQTSCYSLAKVMFEHKLKPTEYRMQRLIAIASGQYPTAAN